MRGGKRNLPALHQSGRSNLLKYVPESPTGTVVSLAPSPILDNNGNIRMDWNQSAKNLIYGHYYQDNTSYSTPLAGGNIAGYVGYNYKVGQTDGVVNDIYTFTPIADQSGPLFGIELDFKSVGKHEHLERKLRD